MSNPPSIDEQSKQQDLDRARRDPGERLTTNQGVLISDNHNSLKAGARGPTLLEDFILREKITHFDHERIPERVVHARGSGAHGYFQVYESLAELTSARLLQDPAVKTPVFVRFSTVAGSRGSADTVRDVRGFAVKFYTEDGVFDLVGNNMPVFFIQDAIKFPDLVHALKPEPQHEMPQASSAHDTFWDFISLTPESMHMVMWVLSDRGIPRSYRMMEGFGVHTFRLVNAAGKARFVKFHWKPALGVHALVWDEAQKIAGKDPDYHRRDLWEAIERGAYPEYELGLQILEEQDEFKFDFDVLDATKIWPEDQVPVRRVGRLTLTGNPDNFFTETEQVAFHIGHITPGIDFTNDPLLQGRLFSYLDTQLTRLGGPNFAELPINRPPTPVSNNQRDGFMRHAIDKGRVAYEPNSLAGGCPMHSPQNLRAFASYAEKIDAHKVRERSASFGDHFSQARLFWNSLSPTEQQHLVEAAQFELGKVGTQAIRERMVGLFKQVDPALATAIAPALGVAAPTTPTPSQGQPLRKAPALSMEDTVKNTITSRRIAILAADGCDAAEVTAMCDALAAAGAVAEIVSKRLGVLVAAGGRSVTVDKTLLTSGGSIMYDAVYLPGGTPSVEFLKMQGEALHFINEAYKHCKAIAATSDGVKLAQAALTPWLTLSKPDAGAQPLTGPGLILAENAGDLAAVIQPFMEAVSRHRYFDRMHKDQTPA